MLPLQEKGPLLDTPSLSEVPHKTHEEEDPETMFDSTKNPPSIWSMTKLFSRIAVPSVFTNIMGFLNVVINTVIIGRMDDSGKMAAYGLANVSHTILILGVMIGLNAAQETLTS